MAELKTVSARLNWSGTKGSGVTNFFELNLVTGGWKILFPENREVLVKSVSVHSYMPNQTAVSDGSLGYLTKFEAVFRPLLFSGQRKFQSTGFSALNTPNPNVASPSTAFRMDSLTQYNNTLNYCEVCGGIEFERISIVQNNLPAGTTDASGIFYVTVQYYI